MTEQRLDRALAWIAGNWIFAVACIIGAWFAIMWMWWMIVQCSRAVAWLGRVLF